MEMETVWSGSTWRSFPPPVVADPTPVKVYTRKPKDEITPGRAEVLAVIRDLVGSGLTMVLATHEMAFARDVSHRVAFLHGGRVLESGPPEQVLRDPVEERTQQFLRRVIDAGRL